MRSKKHNPVQTFPAWKGQARRHMEIRSPGLCNASERSHGCAVKLNPSSRSGSLSLAA